MTVEKVCCDAIDKEGKMTKDLALAIHGSKLRREHYMNTGEFMEYLSEKLKIEWSALKQI